MTDQDVLDRLDERGRAAAGALRRAVEQLPLPDIAAGQRRRRPDRRAVLAVAAALVALVGGLGAFIALRGGDDGTRSSNVSTQTGAVRPYEISDLPAGYRLAIAARTDAAAPVGDTGRLTTYGPSADQPALAVLAYPTALPLTGPTFDVAGHPASYTGLGPRDHVLSIQFGKRRVVLESPRLGRGELVRIGETVRLIGQRAHIDEELLPTGFEPIVRDVPRLLDVPLGFLLDGRGATVTALGGPPGGAVNSVATASGPGDAVTLDRLRRVMEEPTDVEVRGHQAIAGSVPVEAGGHVLPPTPLPMVVLAWEERPGEVIVVSGLAGGQGADAAVTQLRRFSDSLRPMSSAAFRKIAEASARAVQDTPVGQRPGGVLPIPDPKPRNGPPTTR